MKNNTTNVWIDGSTTRIAYLIDGLTPQIVALPKKVTVNEGEYAALICALYAVIDLGFLSVNFFSDSQLIVRQMSGKYRCKNQRMKALLDEAHRLADLLQDFTLIWLPREENKAGFLLE